MNHLVENPYNVHKTLYKSVKEIASTVSRLKSLILDDETMKILNRTISHKELLNENICLFEMITNVNKNSMQYLNGIFFIFPTLQNITLLSNEIKYPKYAAYYIFFPIMISEELLTVLSKSDVCKVIKSIKIVWSNYYTPGDNFFTLDSCEKELSFEIISEKLSHALLSLKISPFIRYQGCSTKAHKIAQTLSQKIKINSNQNHQNNWLEQMPLFKYKDNYKQTPTTPLLLILDRSEDFVTPLLTDWSYKSLITSFSPDYLSSLSSPLVKMIFIVQIFLLDLVILVPILINYQKTYYKKIQRTT